VLTQTTRAQNFLGGPPPPAPLPTPQLLYCVQVAEEVEAQLQKYKAAVDEINAKTGGDADADSNGDCGGGGGRAGGGGSWECCGRGEWGCLACL
jgi:hypothetical protein